MTPSIAIAGRKIGQQYPPLVVAEIGINHEGDIRKAKRMIDDAARAGAECVKFQSHIIEDEMSKAARKAVPGNAKESIWKIMSRCALTEAEEKELKFYTERRGMIYLCTPFSRAAADRLEKMKVVAYKIGSGECNNYPLVEHIARFGKPVIISTGMNDVSSVRRAVQILESYKVPYALLQCTSMYPTPYNKVRLGALAELRRAFPRAVLGLSDHSLGNYACFAAAALGASVLEKHFTSSRRWKGPDVSISITPNELRELVEGARAIHEALGGRKEVLPEEAPTIAFAYATVVTVRPIIKGSTITGDDVWVKRPGVGEIPAAALKRVIGRRAVRDLPSDRHLRWADVK